MGTRVCHTALVVAVLIASAAVSSTAHAQSAEPSEGLTHIPVQLPFETLQEAVVVRDQERLLVRDVGAPLAACVEALQDAHQSGDAADPGWRVSGFGYDRAADGWRFGLLLGDRALHDLLVTAHEGGCRLEVDAAGHAVLDDTYLYDWPPFLIPGGVAIEVDVLAPADQAPEVP